MKKRILSLLLAICLAAGLLPMAAFAVEPEAAASVVEVSDEAGLRKAIFDDGATSIKLMDNIKITGTLEWKDKEITLDLNGYVLESSNSYWVITLKDGDSQDNTSLTLIDSDPDKTNTVGDKEYKGGVINDGIIVTADGYGSNDCRLYANGGSVTANVALHSLSASIRCTSDTPTAFYGNAGQYGKVYGGIFYSINKTTDLHNLQGSTITFKYNDSTYAREVVESGKTAVAPIPPQEPDENGYHINWYQENATVSYDFSTPVTENITLTAEWENTYRITYNTGCDTKIAPIMQAVATGVTLPAAPTRTGYTFEGWNDGTATYQAGETYTMPAQDVNFTALWTANQYKITYKGMAGAEYEGTLPTTHTYDTATEISDPTKDGYTFAGWLVNGEGELKENLTLGATAYTADITLKAVWTVDTYTVTLDTNGGTILAGDVTEYTYGVGAKLPVLVARSGYFFGGWYDNEACTGKPVTEITATDTGNKTFYASWIAFSGIPNHPSIVNPFVDVPVDAYYYNAVLWAVKNGITSGVDDTHFAPNAPCTRAQSVTFLWRAAGSPAPQSRVMPFTDVAEGSYCYNAVLWAVENGITKGTSGTTFSPDATCSRGQIVTFLWRSQNSPAAGSVNPFADVKADDYYADAVLWAVKENVTNGTSDTTFSPADDCIRAQIVTFLWRALDQ